MNVIYELNLLDKIIKNENKFNAISTQQLVDDFKKLIKDTMFDSFYTFFKPYAIYSITNVSKKHEWMLNSISISLDQAKPDNKLNNLKDSYIYLGTLNLSIVGVSENKTYQLYLFTEELEVIENKINDFCKNFENNDDYKIKNLDEAVTMLNFINSLNEKINVFKLNYKKYRCLIHTYDKSFETIDLSAQDIMRHILKDIGVSFLESVTPKANSYGVTNSYVVHHKFNN